MRQALSIFSLSIIFFVSMTSKARADFDREGFKSQLDAIACAQVGDCRRLGLEIITLFDQSTLAPEIASSLPRLQRIAEDQASIWGDTILEGPYDADGKTVLDRVDGLVRDGKVVAYRIVYSERARSGRKQGRISEASFVSPSLGSWFRDERALAEFAPF